VTASSAVAPRPRLRGAVHRWSVPVAVALAVIVVARAPSGGTRAGLVVYGCCVTAMLTVSAVYHSPLVVDAPRRWLWRRFDHAAILVGTAGTYTAVVVLALDGTTRVVLLVLAWAVAGVGVLVRMLWFDAPPWLTASVYLGAGWMVLVDVRAYVQALSGVELAFVVAGGIAYTLGAVVFATRRPNPWPATFGYHEVFHVAVVVGALCHWVAVYLLAGA
jgi:hemolysin III